MSDLLRQTVCRQLQNAVVDFCERTYPSEKQLEVDGIICISFSNSVEQHVVKIHEILNNRHDGGIGIQEIRVKDKQNPKRSRTSHISGSSIGYNVTETFDICKMEENQHRDEEMGNINAESDFDSRNNYARRGTSNSPQFHGGEDLVSNVRKEYSSEYHGGKDEQNSSGCGNLSHSNDGQQMKTYSEVVEGECVIIKMEPVDESEMGDFFDNKSSQNINAQTDSGEIEGPTAENLYENLYASTEIHDQTSNDIYNTNYYKNSQDRVRHRSYGNDIYNSRGDGISCSEKRNTSVKQHHQSDLSSESDIKLEVLSTASNLNADSSNAAMYMRSEYVGNGASSFENAHSNQHLNIYNTKAQGKSNGRTWKTSLVKKSKNMKSTPSVFVEGGKGPLPFNSDEKERKFFCRTCGKGFTMKCTRTRHERAVCGGNNINMYKCHLCDKVFNRSDSRCRHMLKTHGIKANSNYSFTFPT